MDFLTLFAIYVVLVLTCIALVCKYSGQQQTPFNTLLNSVGKVKTGEPPNSFFHFYKPALSGAVALISPGAEKYDRSCRFSFTGSRSSYAKMAPNVYTVDLAQAFSSKVCSLKTSLFPQYISSGLIRKTKAFILVLYISAAFSLCRLLPTAGTTISSICISSWRVPCMQNSPMRCLASAGTWTPP